MTGVGIVGYGHVGRAMARLFPAAAVHDPYLPEYADNAAAVSAAAIGIVCVPTPAGPDGNADLTALTEVLGWLDSEIILIKSTVPPGTTDRLRAATGKRLVCSPEFYGESRFQHPWADDPGAWPYLIVGGEPADTQPVVSLFASVLGPQRSYRQVPATTAELAKYMENSWLAGQVAFAWQFGLLSRALAVDYWEVRELWALDPRVSRWHTALFEDSPGFDGKCLPKDVRAIAEVGRQAGIDVGWLDALLAFNQRLRADLPDSGPESSGSDSDPVSR